ncbi:MAG: translation initiation factor IF-2 [Parcubacteria group bacterium]|jgi:translation initiation factor IF-2
MDNENQKLARIPASVTVKRLAEILNLPISKIITELMGNNILATINEEIDFETASIIAQDLGFSTKEDALCSEKEIITLEKLVEIIKKEKESDKILESRSPIVTILGHVDHGKTTLLDTIRKTSVAAKEAGGITQHISAYQVKKKGEWITFVDTPGHEAFSAMRERGVSIADVAVLVVAADDGVRPQTKEVISYLKEKKMPVIVAINKVDKPEANIIKVKQELADNGIVIEEWGGDVIAVEVSAKQGLGIDNLLENILLVTEVEDFKADFKRDGLAIILEAHLDSKKGPVATALVKTGTLKVGQDVVAGVVTGRIRRMEDFTGRSVNVAEPSMPVTIMGLGSVAKTNDILQIVSKKSFSEMKSQASGSNALKTKIDQSSLEGGVKRLKVILKTDVQGSLEAIEQILSTIKSEDVAVQYIGTGVGNITESDVKIAESAGAIIFGFNVVVTPVAKRLSEGAGVSMKVYNIIYELVEEVKKMLSDMLPVEIERTDLGILKVLAIFKTGKRDMIVGGRVSEGKMIKGENIEVKREGEIIGKGKMANLQQNKQNTQEVNQGNECGLTFEGGVKIKEGDNLICYREEEKKRKL